MAKSKDLNPANNTEQLRADPQATKPSQAVAAKVQAGQAALLRSQTVMAATPEPTPVKAKRVPNKLLGLPEEEETELSADDTYTPVAEGQGVQVAQVGAGLPESVTSSAGSAAGGATGAAGAPTGAAAGSAAAAGTAATAAAMPLATTLAVVAGGMAVAAGSLGGKDSKTISTPVTPELSLGGHVNDGATAAEATGSDGVVTVVAASGASTVVTFTNGSNTVTKTIIGNGSSPVAVTLTSADLTTLGDGTVSVSAVTTASDGGKSATAAISFVLDSGVPDAPTLALGSGLSDGANGAEAVAAGGAVTVVAESGASVAVTFTNGNNTVSKTVTGNGATPVAVTLTSADLTTLGNGTISVSAVASDAAGNESNAGAASFVLDTTAPVAPTLVLGTGVTGGATSAEAVAAGGAVTVVAESGASVAVTFTNGNNTVSKTVTGNGATPVAVTLTSADLTTLGNGTISVSAIATDAAGNASSAGTSSFVLDTVAPVAPTLALGAGVSNGATSAEAIAASGAVTVVAESGASVAVTFTNGNNTVSKTVTGNGATPVAVTLTSADLTTLGNGTISVSAVASDAAGNESNAGAASFVLDTTAPVAPTLVLGTGMTSGTVTVQAETEASVAVTFTNGNNTVSKTVTGNGSTPVAVTLTNADLITLGEGTISVSAVATDAAGNASTAATSSFELQAITVLDGRIKNANVYVDTNNNGTLEVDADTKVGTTDEQGVLKVDAAAVAGKTLLTTGGVDISTGLAFTGVMKAVAGASIVSPLTTLVHAVATSQSSNPTAAQIQAAEAKVKEALGLSGVTESLQNYNPLAVLEASGSSTAAQNTAQAVLKAAIQVANLISVAASAVKAEDAASTTTAAQATFAQLGTAIADASGSYDLSNAANITAVLSAAGLNANVTAIAATIAASNTQIAASADLAAAVQVQTVAQGTVAALVEQANYAALSYYDSAAEVGSVAANVVHSTSLGISSNKTILKAGDAATLTFKFSKAPTGFELADIVVEAGQGTVSDLSAASTNSTTGEVTYTATFTPTADTQDSAVNISVAGTAYTLSGSTPQTAQTTLPVDTLLPSAPTLALGTGVSNGATSAEAVAAGGAVTVLAETASSVEVTFTNGSHTVSKTVTGNGTTPVPVTLTSADLTTLGDGTISISAVATDAAGNASNAGSASFVLDTTAPTAPTLALGAGVSNGATSAEAVAAGGAVTVVAESGASVAVTFTNGSNTVSKTVTGNGTTPVAVTLTSADLTALGNGTISVSATQTDVAGNLGSAATTSFVLDTTAPTAPTLALGTGVSNGATSAEATAAGGAVAVVAESGASVAVTFTNGSNTVSKTVTGTGSAQAVTLSSADLTTLGDGTISVSAIATDAAGNASSAGTSSFLLDTVAPVAPTLALGAGVSNGATSAEAIAAGGAVTVVAESGASTVVTFTNGSNTVSKTVTGNGTTPVAVTLTSGDLTTLGDGTISVSATATDAAGNASSAGTSSFVLDTVAPTAPALALGAGVSNGATSAEATAAGGAVTVVAESGASVAVTFTNGSNTVSKTVTGNGSTPVAVALTSANLTTLGNGTISVSATQTDEAGNLGSAGTTSFVLDTVAPTAPTLALGTGVSNGATSLEVTAAGGAVTVVAETDASVAVTFTNGSNTVSKTVTGNGTTPVAVALTSADLTTLGDGTISVSAVVTDAAGNASSAGTSSFVLDTAAPEAPTLALGTGVTDGATSVEATAASGAVTVVAETDASVAVTFTNGSNTVSKTVTGNGTTPVAVALTSADLTTLGNGTISVSATQTDVAGNLGSAGTTSFVLDTVAPTAPTLALGTGVSNGATSAEATAAGGAVTVVAESGASVAVTFTNGSNTVSKTVTGNGSTPVAVALTSADLTTLGDGTISVSAIATDVAGNASSAGTRSFVLDTVAPDVPTLALGTGVTGGATSAEAVAADGAVTVVAETGANTVVTFTNGSNTVSKTITGNGTTPVAVTLTSADLTALGNGTISVSAVVTDAAGNASSAGTSSFVLDTAAPAAPTLALGTEVSNGATSLEATAEGGAVTVVAESGANVAVTFTNGSNTVSKTVTGNGTTPVAVTLTSADLTTLGNGTISVSTTQTDVAGNLGSAGSASFVLDTVAPTAPTLALGAGVSNGATSAEAVAAGGAVTVVAEAGASVAVTFTNGSNTVSKTVTGNGTTPVAVTLTSADLTTLGNGTISVSATQTDVAGNLGSAGTTSFVLDTVAPTAPTLALGTGVSNGATSAEATAAGGAVAVVAESGASVAVTFTNGSNTVSKTVTGTGSAQAVTLSSADLTTLGDGTISVSAIATDAAGNASSAGTSSFLLDTVAPVAPTLALGAGVSNGATSAEAIAAGGAVTVVAESGASTVVTFTNGSNTVSKTVTGNGTTPVAVTLTSGDLTTLGDGTISVSATATDAAGNASSAGTSSFVLDTVAPTAPALALGAGVSNGATSAEATAAGGAVTVVAESGASVAVTFTNGSNTVSKTVTGNGSTPVAVALTSANLTTLGDGTISVSAIATDAAGNASSAGTRSFVLDTTAPVAPTITLGTGVSGGATSAEAIAAGGVLTVLAESGAATVVTFTNGSNTVTKNLTANGAAQVVTLTSSDLTTLGNGTISVSVVATDAAGNASNAGTSSFVLDTVAPVAPTLALGTGVTGGATSAEATAAGGAVTVMAEVDANVAVTFTNGSNTVSKTVTGNGTTPVAVALTSADLTALGDGTISVSATQTDVAGNIGIAGTTSFVLDTVAPAAPTLAVAAAGSYNLVTVLAETGSSVAVTFTNGAQTLTKTVTGAGASLVTVLPNSTELAALGPGTISVSAVATDAAGNASSATTSSFTYSPTVNLSTIAAGSGGFVINGVSASESGYSVSGAGDVNGDGIPDLLVGAPSADPASGSNAGISYVVFGSTGTTAIDLSAVAAGSGGFAINGPTSSQYSGTVVSNVGDINGDGLADMFASSSNSGGNAYVVFGKTGTTAVELSALGTNGFVINRVSGTDQIGSTGTAGDVNGDGLVDLIVSAKNGDPLQGGVEQTDAGATYVVFGKTGTTAVYLSSVAQGTGGFVINGQCAADSSGMSASTAGDVNGDGLADLLVGASQSDLPTGTNSGRAYVVFGKTGTTAVDLSAIAQGSGGFVVNAQCSGDALGTAVFAAGDVNGDGLADVVMASPSGRSYVVFGKAGTTAVDASAVAAGTGGFMVKGMNFNIVSSAGDINGDGLADLLMGARYADPVTGTDAGSTYVVFGKTGTATIEVSAIANGIGGFVVYGESAGDNSGIGVASAGDINGDGYADLVVGAYWNAPVLASTAQTKAGRSYVIYGGTQFTTGAVAVATGTSANELVVGTSGADTLTGNGGVDNFRAGAGNDIVVLTASDVSNLASNSVTNARTNVNGGSGYDALRLSGGASLDLTAISNVGAMTGGAGMSMSRINSIERIDMSTDTAANTLTLAPRDVNDMAGMNLIYTGAASADGRTWTNTSVAPLAASTPYHQLVVDGTSADTLNLSNLTDHWYLAGSAQAVQGAATTNYLAYQNDLTRSQLLVNQSIKINVAVPSVALSTVAAGTGGFVISGLSESDNSGWSVSNAGDVNGDGLPDLIVGAHGSTTAAGAIAGRSYVVFGKTDTTALSLAALTAASGGTGGFVINGLSASDWTGNSVSGAGDINGDGLADLLVGAPNSDPAGVNSAGRSYVVFGKTGTTPVDLSAVVDDTGGFVINGQSASDWSGGFVSNAGDVNGDGLSDFIVAATGADPAGGTDAGRAYVVFGKLGTDAVELSAVVAGTGGFVINGQCTSDILGRSASNAGDVNGDGLTDLIVSATDADTAAGADAGRSYVVFGKTGTTAIDLSAVVAGIGGFAINGQSAGDRSGYSVSNAGDVNGDGLSDVIVGAQYNDPAGGTNAGSSYVVFGKKSTTAIDLSAVAAGSGGFVIYGRTAGDYSGESVSSAGDFNGDGYADLIVSTTHSTGLTGVSSAGRTYVVFGKNSTTAIDLSAVANGVGGFAIHGLTSNEQSGTSVSSAGDLNGDGYADLIVGAGRSDPASGTNAGRSYVIYGGSQYVTRAVALGTGTVANELVVGTNGDDVLTGGGGTDRFRAGAGNDTVELTGTFAVDGGGGYDSVRLSGGASMNLLTLSNVGAMNGATGENLSVMNSVERVDMATDTTANTLTLAPTDVNDMAGMNLIHTGSVSADGNTWTNVSGTALAATTPYHQLVVDGGNNDALTLQQGPGNWQWAGQVSNGSATYEVYQNSFTHSQVLAKTALPTAVVMPTLSVSNLANGIGGFVINGQSADDWSGYSVSSAGDVNGDGLTDLIVGARSGDSASVTDAGRSYVVFGKTDGVPVDLSAVAAGTGGFVINGQSAYNYSGSSVSNAGDLNGDGLADLLVGAYAATAGSNASGRSYVVYGKTDTAAVDLSAVFAGSGGFALNGKGSNDYSGYSVSNGGDVNGDGLADLVVGAYGSSSPAGGGAGRSYVLFGQTNLSTLDLSALAAGTGGFVINGQSIADESGVWVSSAGDVNGDGLADVVVGARKADPSAGSDAGRAYVVFGKADTTAIDLSAVAAGTGGFVMNGQGAGDWAGNAVSGAGDVNGDGLADLIVGATGVASSKGRAYVVFGKTGTTAIDLSAVAGGTGGFAINGQTSNEYTGVTVSSAGDINGDGLADLLVGSNGSSKGYANSYVVFGKTGGTAIDVSAVAGGTGGFAINNPSDYSIAAVSNAGDVNGDGYADLLVGTMKADPVVGGSTLTDAGRSYLVFGGPQFVSGAVALGAGTSANELVVGTSGADTLSGGGGVDSFTSGAGNDTVVLTASDVSNLANNTIASVKARVDGGSGFDTLKLTGGANLDLTTVSNVGAMTGESLSRVSSIERIDLATDTAANTLTLGATDVNDMAGMNLIHTGTASADGKTWTNVSGTPLAAKTPYHQLVVDGTAVDVVNLKGTAAAWTKVGVANDGTSDYTVYQSTVTNSQVLVKQGVVVPLQPVNLYDIAQGAGGFVINPDGNNDWLGYSMASAGDVNGDGLSDIIVGAYFSDPTSGTNAGRSYVVFGSSAGTAVDLSSLANDSNTAGFVIRGASGDDQSGFSVSSAGDINGDGLADLLVGARGADPSSKNLAGASYVVYGKANGSTIDLANLVSSDGFVIQGATNNNQLGFAVSNAGDVDGDGRADLLVAAPLAGSNAGTSYVLFGKALTGTLDLNALATSQGFAIYGASASDFSGVSVSAAGDFNGDGLGDLLIGASGVDTSGKTDAGAAYVVYGKADGTAVQLNALVDAQGMAIYGAAASNGVGTVVSAAGDVNGDGLADLIIGSAPSGADASYVVFGRRDLSSNSTTTSLDLATLASASSNGFAIKGYTSANRIYAGLDVSYAGDINGDGLSDLLVQSGPDSSNLPGKAHVVFGNTGGIAPISLSQVEAGVGGFVITPGSLTTAMQTWSVAAGGDLNGDGYADLLVGTPNGGQVAHAYAIYGGPQLSTAVVALGTGTSANERVVGTRGADTLTGGGGVDNFSAGDGNDTVVLSASDVSNLANNSAASVKASVDGGGDFDTLQLSGGANLDLTAISNVGAMTGAASMSMSRINSIERIDLATDTAANTLTLTGLDVGDMAGMNLIHTGTASADGKTWTNVSGTALADITKLHQLVIDGTGTDVVNLVGVAGWSNVGTVSDGTSQYTVYQNVTRGAQVLVESGVTVNQNVMPVVLDLNGDGVLQYGQTRMDVNGDCVTDLTAWAGAQDGVLVHDANGDGQVNGAAEFAFARHEGETDLQGLAAQFDSHRDGVLDMLDAQFAEFAVWQDANGNGASDAGELHSLSALGITAIGLVSDGVQRTPAAGVTEAGRTSAQLLSGTQMLVSDASFTFAAAPTQADPATAVMALFDGAGSGAASAAAQCGPVVGVNACAQADLLLQQALLLQSH